MATPFLSIAKAMTNIGDRAVGLWDEDDEFFYDTLRFPDGKLIPLKVRSMVGLIPFYAVEIIEPEILERLPDFKRRLEWFLNYRPDLIALVSHWNEPGRGDRRLLSLLRNRRIKKLLQRMLDESEFLSDYGVRSLSRAHLDAPYAFCCAGYPPLTVNYQPGESETGVFGGNSNWRGPVWFPVNYLLITSLKRFAEYYGEDFRIECPTGSGSFLSLDEVADELALRLTRIFRRGDDGRGIGASHQTGWTGLVAKLLQPRKSA